MEKKIGTFVFISGSPGAAQIGNFLLENKDFFIKHFHFKMKRIMPQEISKFNKVYKSFPALKINGEKIYGEKNIIAYLNFTVNPPGENEPESHDDVIAKNMVFTNKNGNITFEDEDEKEDFEKELARKTAEFTKKRGGKAQITTAEKKEKAKPRKMEVSKQEIDNPEEDVEQYRLNNIF